MHAARMHRPELVIVVDDDNNNNQIGNDAGSQYATACATFEI
jgi:hypothetical protein